MAKSKVVMNHAGSRDLLKSPEVADALLAMGSRVAATMNSTAPVDSGALSRSHYAEAVQHPSRVVVQVGSDLGYAAEVMVRTGYAARALDSA
jgi:hypothetical protein